MPALNRREDPWDPYIRVPAASRLDTPDADSKIVRALLLHRAVRQARGIVKAIQEGEFDRLPLVVRSLDQETGGRLTRRIANMLGAYVRFLDHAAHADVREKLGAAFEPMSAWVGGQFAVTSPALLVVQCILYSHCEWIQEDPFEAYSAARAYEELEARGYPELHRRFVSAVITHQTLLRAAWSIDPVTDPRETLAFYYKIDKANDHGRVAWAEEEFDDPREKSRWCDEMVGRALARTLFPFLKEKDGAKGDAATMDRRESISALRLQLSAALLLHCLCLHCRHERKEPQTLPVIKPQGLRFVDHLLNAETPLQYDPHLAFFQLGRYVCAAQQTSGMKLFEDAKRRSLDAASTRRRDISSRPILQNVSFCFQRVIVKRAWEQEKFDPSRVERPRPYELRERGGIWKLIGPTVGALRRYRLNDQEHIVRSLGLT